MSTRPPPITLDQARAFVTMWRAWFRLAPASVCLTLMEIESSFRPDAHATSTGARGLLQVLPTTAQDMVAKVRRRLMSAPPPGAPSPADTLKLWDPAHLECLFNPALGSLVGVVYLDHLAEQFGPRLELLAAAYHNGPGFLRSALKAGTPIPDGMPPLGKAYVRRALSIVPKYSNEDDDDLTPTPSPPRGVPTS
jgi:soluble lytic murein transglycosylase-like protein